jgi:acyl-CoA dehydrogenase
MLDMARRSHVTEELSLFREQVRRFFERALTPNLVRRDEAGFATAASGPPAAMNEYPIARLWRDSRVTRIYGGTNEIMKEVIGRAV